jgi:hypothetical protein
MYSLGPDNWTRLVLWLIIGQIIFFLYGRRHSTLRQGKTVAYTLLDRALTFANIGFLVGGTVGFLMRPGNLGFQTVIERGINLTDPALRPLAHAAFNSMVLGAFIGAAVGALFGYLVYRLQAGKVSRADSL